MVSDGISIDGQAMKTILAKKDPKMSYTSRDYQSIFSDLVNTIPDVSEKWITRDESDPGIVLLKLISIYGDMLSYNMDKQTLECFPNSVTQRKNAAQIFSLIGYKMHWYRSARVWANITNTYAESATIQKFSRFTTADGQITYTNLDQIEVESNSVNNGINEDVELIQGVPVTPPLKSGAKIPAENKPWHDIYTSNVNASDILGNKIYLKDTTVDETSIVLVDNFNEEWTLVDSVNLQVEAGKFFEMRVDEYDRPYLYLVNYWKNMNILNFKLFYVVSKGKEGQIQENTLKKIDTPVYAIVDPASSKVVNVQNYIKFTNYESGYGWDPETPDEARENSAAYVNTLNTLVTLDDFTRFGMRQLGVANCLATDCTTDPGTMVPSHYGNLKGYDEVDREDLKILRHYIDDPITYPLTENQLKLADLNNDGQVDELDYEMMQNYIAGNYEAAGRCGEYVELMNPLDDLTVKLYVLKQLQYEALEDDETFKQRIYTALRPYKLMPLEVIVDTENIKVYYWTIRGRVYLKRPVRIDTAQDLLVTINNQLTFDFDRDKMPFNTAVSYIDVVHSIEDKASPSLIDHVVLDPIVYTTEDGEEVDLTQVTGENTVSVPLKPMTSEIDESLTYEITLPNAPVKPNSFSLNINEGEYVLRDNGDGKISNKDGVLQEPGEINYITGEVKFKFSSEQTSNPRIKYKQNVIVSVQYANLNSQTFEVAEENILTEDNI